MTTRKNNHFLPKMYLKNWANDEGKVFQYKKVVPNENDKLWKEVHPSAIAYTPYLYVDSEEGRLDDGLEYLFSSEYEDPASDVIEKLLSDKKLTKMDYEILVKFLLIQNLRTPKRYFEFLSHTETSLKEIVDDVFQENKIPSNFQPSGEYKYHEKLPMRLFFANDSKGELNAEVSFLKGRKMWLWFIKYILDSSIIEEFYKNSWTILHPADGMSWFTSDNPVVFLNYEDEINYNLNGKLKNINNEIMLPFGPQHLFYTQIGRSPPIMRGTSLSKEKTMEINRMILENSHRFIVSNKMDDNIEVLLPRIVDRELYNRDKNFWKDWHNDNLYQESKFYK